MSKKKPITWAHRATTETLEREQLVLKKRATLAQGLVDHVLTTYSVLRDPYPEVQGALAIAEQIRNRTRSALELVDAVLATREDKFDLDASVDRILKEGSK